MYIVIVIVYPIPIPIPIYQLRMSRFDLQNPPFRAGYRYEYRILWGTSGTEITTTHPGSLL